MTSLHWQHVMDASFTTFTFKRQQHPLFKKFEALHKVKYSGKNNHSGFDVCADKESHIYGHAHTRTHTHTHSEWKGIFAMLPSDPPVVNYPCCPPSLVFHRAANTPLGLKLIFIPLVSSTFLRICSKSYYGAFVIWITLANWKVSPGKSWTQR